MFIQTEETPNPNALKFLPGVPVMRGAGVGVNTAEFDSAEAAEVSPLGRRLFRINGVTRLFYADESLTVTKDEGQPWMALKPLVLAAIMDHFTQSAPLFDQHYPPKTNSEDTDSAGVDLSTLNPADKEIVEQIQALLESHVRPAVARDGGDITFDSFNDGVVFLRLRGACAGCPSSTMTLKMGVENLLRHYIPEVIEVRAAA